MPPEFWHGREKRGNQAGRFSVSLQISLKKFGGGTEQVGS